MGCRPGKCEQATVRRVPRTKPHQDQNPGNPTNTIIGPNAPAFSVLNLRERTVPGSMDRESARWPLLREEENGSVWGLICKL